MEAVGLGARHPLSGTPSRPFLVGSVNRPGNIMEHGQGANRSKKDTIAEQPKPQEVQELVRGKASELVTMFTNYLKDKTICEGRIGLEAAQDEKGYTAFLKVARGKSNAEFRLGMGVLQAYYDEEKNIYRLNRYSQPIGPKHGEQRQDAILVGSYGSADELMKAVAEEVSKL